MKTVEITRHKQMSAGAPVESTFKVFLDIYKREGLAGINKGVNAVAVRQATNWGSRFGFARLAEAGLRNIKGIKEGEKLGAMDKILASTLGGALATWNQPIEVVRVEVHSPTSSVFLSHVNIYFLTRCNPLLNPKTPLDRPRRLFSTPSLTFTRPTVSKVFTGVLRPELAWELGKLSVWSALLITSRLCKLYVVCLNNDFEAHSFPMVASAPLSKSINRVQLLSPQHPKYRFVVHTQVVQNNHFHFHFQLKGVI